MIQTFSSGKDSDMRRVVENGFGIVSLVVLADDMLGFPTMITYTQCVFWSCIATFFSTGLFKIMDEGLT